MLLEEEIKYQIGGEKFVLDFQQLLDDYLDISYERQRLKNQPLLILKNVLEMVKLSNRSIDKDTIEEEKKKIKKLEHNLVTADGKSDCRQQG